jgi:hypothetical protein
MLLSISEAKVAEVLQSADRAVAIVSTSTVPVARTKNYSPDTNYGASSTVPIPTSDAALAPLLVTAETSEQFAALRRQIEGSGAPLKSAEELTREIDEMRGRR